MSEHLSLWRPVCANADCAAVNQAFEIGIHWLPLFVCTYLFYCSWKQSYTGGLVFWSSMILLLSGLLPGDGYSYVCSVLFYTLFVAIVVTLILDLHPKVFETGSVATDQRTQPAVP